VRIAYLVKRILLLFLSLWAAATLNFFLPRIAPRNPIRERLITMSQQGGYIEAGIEDMIKAYEEKFGLDQPLWKQYMFYLSDMARLDLGYSLAMAWPKSPRWIEWAMAPLMTVSAVPYYLFSLLLIYLLAFRAKIFPLGGGYTLGTIPDGSLRFYLDAFKHSLLPALSMVIAGLGGRALGMRGMMVTIQGEDYMVLAEAKGLKGTRIFLRYGMRNALLPSVTSLALSFAYVVSGSVLVERVFGYPGIGSLLATSVQAFDYFTIYGIVFMVILGIGLATLLLDLTYPLLDPRITYERN